MNLLQIVTVQTGAFKHLIEALKDMLFDCNVEFVPNDKDKKNGYIKILALNNQMGMLVHLRLLAINFDEFSCATHQVIGINMQVFHKVIKAINNTDILTLHRENIDDGKLSVTIMNKEKQQVFQYSLQIIDVENDVIDISQASFQAVVIMNSVEFQKVCRVMNDIEAKYVDIELVNNIFRISARGDNANGLAEFTDNPNSCNGITINRKQQDDEQANERISGRYELKNLVLFTRCTNLCNNIEIYLKNDYPLLIKYTVASLGYMHLCLSPIIEE